MATNTYPDNIDAGEQKTAIAVMGKILDTAFHRAVADYDVDVEAAVIDDFQSSGVTLEAHALSDNDLAGWLQAVAPGIIKYIEDLRASRSFDTFSGTPITMTSEPNTTP